MLNDFTGKLKDGDKKYKGKFDIPNLSEENDTDEIDVSEAWYPLLKLRFFTPFQKVVH